MKIMKRHLLTVLALSALAFNSFAADFSAEENAMIQDVLKFRVNLRTLSDADSCIKKIEEYKAQQAELFATACEEAQIVLNNMLATAHYNCEYEKDMHSPLMEGLLRPQYEKLTAYAEGKTAEELNPWFVLTSADITNSMMQFLPRSASITVGLQEKKDYAVVVKNNPEMPFALTLSGWWYYYAPGVGGGSVSKAGDFFKDAQKYAETAYDRYYCNINLAQFYFEQKDQQKCDFYMAEAEKILPGTRYCSLLKSMNRIGYSLFDYNMNSRREKIDRKLMK
jgi:hypothetical protein